MSNSEPLLTAQHYRELKVFGSIIERILIWSPWVWIISTGLLVLSLYFKNGEMPTYGNPDPFNTGIFNIFSIPSRIAFLPVIISIPTAVLLIPYKAWQFSQGDNQRRHLIEIFFFLIGISIFLSVTWWDGVGLMYWYMD